MRSCFNRLFVTAMLICSTMCLSAAAEADVPTGNFLSNSGFESGELFPWRTGSKYTYLQEWSVTANDSQAGLFSAQAIGDVGLRQDFAFPIDASDIKELTFWVKTPNAYVELGVIWHLPGGTYHQTGVVSDRDWKFIDATPFINRNMTDITAVELFGYSTNNLPSAVTYYDNIQLLVVPEPSTMTLFLGAALCVLRRPRKIKAHRDE